MTLKEIAPWRWGGLRRFGEEDRPVESFFREMATVQREMERLFDDLFRGGGRQVLQSTPWHSMTASAGTYDEIVPRIDEMEDEKSIKVQVELPGLDKEDIDITLSNGYLTIRGEKKRTTEEKGKDFYRKERSFGAFRRVLPIPTEVNQNAIEASFKRGVLHIDLPKTEAARKQVTHIAVKAA